MSHARAHLTSLSIIDTALARVNALIEAESIVEVYTSMEVPELGAVSHTSFIHLVREQPARKGRVDVRLLVSLVLDGVCSCIANVNALGDEVDEPVLCDPDCVLL